jgi:hypothetical protein
VGAVAEKVDLVGSHGGGKEGSCLRTSPDATMGCEQEERAVAVLCRGAGGWVGCRLFAQCCARGGSVVASSTEAARASPRGTAQRTGFTLEGSGFTAGVAAGLGGIGRGVIFIGGGATSGSMPSSESSESSVLFLSPSAMHTTPRHLLPRTQGGVRRHKSQQGPRPPPPRRVEADTSGV